MGFADTLWLGGLIGIHSTIGGVPSRKNRVRMKAQVDPKDKKRLRKIKKESKRKNR